jgi:peptide/nickel transport system permease protein
MSIAASSDLLLPNHIGRASRDWGLNLSAAICVILVLLAIFGSALAPYSPDQISILTSNEGISAHHLLGTDTLGRDILSRILAGARLSLLGPALVITAATALGVFTAISAAWFGGSFERIVKRSLDTLFAFPSLLLAVIAVAVFGTGLVAPVVALAIAYTPYIARVVHSAAARERRLPYVAACSLAGLSAWRICGRHIFGNVAPLVRAQATILFGSALMDLAAISFLGLGVQPPKSEWGLMASDGRVSLLNGFPQESLAAGIVIVITVVAFNVLGERMAARSQVVM